MRQYTLTASGCDIWGQNDQFRYAYVPGGVLGDFVMAAYVDVGGVPHPWGKAGIMVRKSLTGRSEHMMVCATGGNNLSVQGRSCSNPCDSYGTDGRAWVDNDRGYLALVRMGDTGAAFYSDDGVNWGDQPGNWNQGIGNGAAALCRPRPCEPRRQLYRLATALFTNVTLVSAPTDITCVQDGAECGRQVDGSRNRRLVRHLQGWRCGCGDSGDGAEYREAFPGATAKYEVKAVYFGIPLGGGGACSTGPAIDIRSVGSWVIRTWNGHGCDQNTWAPAWNVASIANGDENDHYDSWNAGHLEDFEYIGFEFKGPNGEQNVRKVLQYWFKESDQYGDGGWFDTTPALEVLVDGTWVATGIGSSPAYPGGNGIPNEIFQWDMPDTAAAGVRISGRPGGSAYFISVKEEKGLVRPVVGGFPTCRIAAPETAWIGETVIVEATVGDPDGNPVTILGWDVNVLDGISLVASGSAKTGLDGHGRRCRRFLLRP